MFSLTYNALIWLHKCVGCTAKQSPRVCVPNICLLAATVKLKTDSIYASIQSMNKVVIDTSVLISALIGKTGPAREVIRRCLLGQLKPLISTTLFLEYEAVSKRNKIKELCPLTEADVNELLAAFFSVCEWVQIHYLWRPNLKDEGDNFLIELAVAGNAESIITNNLKDLRNAELQFDGLRVLAPEDYLRGV